MHHRGARLWTALLKHFLPIAAGLPRRQQKHVVGLLRILLLLVAAAVVVGVLLLELINFQRIVFTSNNNGANSDKVNPSSNIISSKTQQQHIYKILCTTIPQYMELGSYAARCVSFKTYVDKCAPSVDIVLDTIPDATSTKQYNSTMFVKGTPSIQSNLGQIYIDVVDGFSIRGYNVPTNFTIIVQNTQHGMEVFPNHTVHVIEHWYSEY